MNPPTATERVGAEPHGLDEKWALKNFLGKSRDDARHMFRRGAVTEDFAYMAPDGLRYYLPAAFDYLRAHDSFGDSDFCHGLLCSLYCQATSSQPLPGDVLTLIKDVAEFSDSHRDKFGLTPREELFNEYILCIRAA
jgi:hypothetical protein